MTLRRPNFVISFCWVTAALGASVLILATTHAGFAGWTGTTFAALFVGVIVGEFAPVQLPLRGGSEETNLSTVFAFALLMHSGLAAAALAQVTASAAQDLATRKPVWRTAFNVGQYVLCLGAASLVISAFGVHLQGHAPVGGPPTMLAIALAGAAFYAVNFLVVGTAVASYQRIPLGTHLRNDMKMTLLMAGVSISLAPVVLVAVDQSPLLLVLFALPFAAVRRSGQVACESAFQAMHDALTGLPNRARFRQMVDEAAVGGGSFAVMLLDLNRFKDINDTLGHHYGDLVLQAAALRLQAALRGGDVVARLGGDEFAVLVRGETPDSVAERISSALRAPVEIDGFMLEVEASVGTARFPQDGADLDMLLRRADVAMYTAKEKHLGHVAYSSGIDEYDPARLALVADLRRALDAEELVVYYQPKLDLGERRVRAVEALVRWQHPRLGLLQPGAFVDMAEHTGLIKPLTNYVLRHALQQSASWADQGLRLQVAVNVSPRSLLDRDLAQTIASALVEARVPADRLKLEITETAIIVDPDTALRMLNQLASMGVALSIDDFGTGYSSLAYLRRLPVGEVKIDKSFVQSMMLEQGDHAIVRSTIELAADLGLAVVAEGVEDSATLEELARLGCDEAQGYYVSHPITAAEVTAALLEPTLGPTARIAPPTLTEAA